MSLCLKNISHHFGDLAAVAGASLDVAPGELVCLFGPSGCGKTTLLRIAAGLESLQAGAVELDGVVLSTPGAETPPEDRPIGLVFQDYVLFPHLTVEKNVAFGLVGQSGVKARVHEQLEALGIATLAKRFPHELSGGQQQRVALARAVARKPKALLLDEPFASIDVTLRRRLRGELRRTLKEQNAAVLLVTHDPEEALALGDRIALMRAGEIVEAASPEELFARPQTPEGAMIFPGSHSLAGEIKAGVFHCVLGSAPTSETPDGRACIIFRPDAVSARLDEAGAFIVHDVRFVGPHWSARLVAADGAHLHVDMPSTPATGARMSISADWGRAFVFSASDA